MGFWSVLAIVVGSQIGSSVFMAPANLAPYGIYAVLGFLLASLGAMALCYVFAFLCSHFPQTGGPHVYVKQMFGNGPAFFTGWTYWVISWVSTPAVIVTAIGYLAPFIGAHNQYVYLALQIALLLAITLLNLKGVKFAGNAEFFLSLLKFIPLIILPVAGFFYFNAENIVLSTHLSESFSATQILGQVALLTLWGFVGLETATAPAGSVENPRKNIPRAMMIGTLCVAGIYILNCVSMMGMMPAEILATSKAPYVDATIFLFGGNWHFLISIIASIVCVGTLNAWVLTSGQIALGLAEDRLLPAFFAKKNRYDAPFWSISISSLGIVPLLLLTSNENFAEQIRIIIDISVTAFLFVYLMCCLSFLTLTFKQKSWGAFFIGLLTAIFCVWIIQETPWATLKISSVFTLSGLPIYLLWYLRQKNRKLGR
jgi:APA family basic amino acid/polyamine antiporter